MLHRCAQLGLVPRRLGVLCALALLLPLRVFGDAVPPPPAKCPRGQVGITSHAGPQCVDPAPKDCPPGWVGQLRGICALHLCETDQSCGSGMHCQQVNLCLQEFILEWGFTQNDSGERPRNRPLFAGPPMRYDPPRHEIRAVDVCIEGRGCQEPAKCGLGKLCLPAGVTRPGIWPKPAAGGAAKPAKK